MVGGRTRLLLAYVTGRHRELALAGLRRHALPLPAFLVCDVGTSVFLRTDEGYQADPGYRQRMAAALGDADRAELQERLARLEGLLLQEAEKQAEFKLSYYTPGGAEGEALAARVREVLAERFGGANVVFSVDTDTGRGLLDVLPPGIAKDSAVRYVCERSGVDRNRILYAGDSGNDRAAMLSGVNTVVVGNAPQSLKEALRAEAAQLGISHRVYFARAHYARGVVEGCRHFGIA